MPSQIRSFRYGTQQPAGNWRPRVILCSGRTHSPVDRSFRGETSRRRGPLYLLTPAWYT